ncbi:PREDICTED: uncharacterized protein LOC108359114 isoform X2 [Rhagoletis zephyria]|uniref:uncharacterized protein LOC108359114 isoform X2 n=1 Tax=Rhagoletis zephyria TaxID=28612 RepID=UPI00081198CE|nr:PREDICTED: uncharacterized protein LOC108359114 isoform X2 [Rhagoletis zephyria]
MIKMQEDLRCLYKWLCVNRLQLNVNKTKFMVISRAANVSSDNYSLKIKDEVIEKVRIIKYLGIYIDDKLKFEEHIDYTVAKIRKKIGLMKRSSSDTQIDKLQKMQNRAMRFILNKRYDTPIQEMIAELNWLSVKQQIFYHAMKFVFNIKQVSGCRCIKRK